MQKHSQELLCKYLGNIFVFWSQAKISTVLWLQLLYVRIYCLYMTVNWTSPLGICAMSDILQKKTIYQEWKKKISRLVHTAMKCKPFYNLLSSHRNICVNSRQSTGFNGVRTCAGSSPWLLLSAEFLLSISTCSAPSNLQTEHINLTLMIQHDLWHQVRDANTKQVIMCEYFSRTRDSFIKQDPYISHTCRQCPFINHSPPRKAHWCTSLIFHPLCIYP